jgi:hypothetical protein
MVLQSTGHGVELSVSYKLHIYVLLAVAMKPRIHQRRAGRKRGSGSQLAAALTLSLFTF